MSLDDLIRWQTSLALQTVNILCKQLKQQAFLMQQSDKRVCDGRPIPARVELLGEGVKRKGVLAEKADIEDGFGVG